MSTSYRIAAERRMRNRTPAAIFAQGVQSHPSAPGSGAVGGSWAVAAGAAAMLALASAAEGLFPADEEQDVPAVQTVYEPAGQYHVRLDASGRYQVQVRGLRPLTDAVPPAAVLAQAGR